MRTSRTTTALLILVSAACAVGSAPLSAQLAQDPQYIIPIPEIESFLREGPIEILDFRGSRAEGDRTQRAMLGLDESRVLMVKWANAAPGGSTFNNEPRYEVAAYEIQKLFLDLDDHVVPPTVARAVPLDWMREYIPDARPTFNNAASVVTVLQYWLLQVTQDDFHDPARFNRDPEYARRLGNFNILTYLIHHGDSNIGNFLISEAPDVPRVFAVDNGVAFRSRTSNRGYEWRNIQVRSLPRATIDRLREVTREDLQGALGILFTFEVRDGLLVPIDETENLSSGRGVRRSGDRIQFGLTNQEINDVHNRLQELLLRVSSGRIETF